MAISANQIVQVLPRILKGTGQDLVFNGMLLDKNARIPTAKPISFSSADDVGDYFGTTSDEYAFASVYFGGYNNSQIKPSLLYFYKLCPNGASPFVRGESLKPADALVALKAITAGDLSITVTGTAYEVTGIDLSASTSLIDVANTVESALTTEGASVTVEFSPIDNSFTITSTAVGNEESITVPTGTVATAMGYAEDTAVVSAGASVMTVTDTMAEITDQFQNFVTFTTLEEASDADALLLANWASVQANAGTMYLYVLWDSSKANLDSTNTTVISELLQAEEVTATCVCYPDFEKAAFIMGTAASIAWDQRNGTLTFKFKAQSGLGADIQDTGSAVALAQHKVNFMGNYATRNDNFVFLANGEMLGEWDWIDTYLNACWLCNASQVQLMSAFTSNRRIPYIEEGYSILRANIRDVMNRALNNGVVQAGVNISDAQKAQLTSELGADLSQELYTNGYILQIVDATANIRQQRTSPACSLVYTYGGAIHKLTLPAIAVV